MPISAQGKLTYTLVITEFCRRPVDRQSHQIVGELLNRGPRLNCICIRQDRDRNAMLRQDRIKRDATSLSAAVVDQGRFPIFTKEACCNRAPPAEGIALWRLAAVCEELRVFQINSRASDDIRRSERSACPNRTKSTGVAKMPPPAHL